MRDFVDTLPLRLAAVVASLVGAVTLWNGVELWESARRIGISFVVMLLAGLTVRRLVLSLHDQENRQGSDGDSLPGNTAGSTGLGSGTASGKNVDVIAPGTPIKDLLRDDNPDDE